MDFDLSEDQRLLQDSLQKLLKDKYGFEQRKGYMKSETGWSRDLWAAYAELGLLGMPFAEADGGLGYGAVETMIVMEQFGRALALEPFVSTVVMGGGFLRHGASAEQRAAMVPEIAAGKRLLAFAHTEPQSRFDLHDVATTAKKDGAGWILDGRKGVVLHGDTADDLVVTARISGQRRDREGIGVFLVPATAQGVSRRGFRTSDGQRAADITFDNVKVGPEAELKGGLALAERVVDETIAALAAEAVGCMEAAKDLTVDYLKTRKQFGRPIGSFQALQHRAAEMMVCLEQARSMAMLAAMMASEPDAAERRRQMRAVKIEVGRNARFVGQQTIQMHGGIAMTMEYAGGHYLKRLTVIENMFGDMDHHLAALSEEGGVFLAA
ncbi:pimeloyl-CoA dehydrogenase small subunit [Roseomonas alkaliterrae]|uniref:Pimeloyl-CoA dehydrogenase small subunit n=1 Tax=Neoroseomonas alkaliterrae TaxID=1452450 RepID=A0A840XRQ2_9PROT|nr:acyl-CoA dehydrogenase family protein [Neoroseomonas alkaliterrae]MBB5691225.1 pimeloyl-CoA dehydrogenase small subunit [Neoroseomonas alkaliterrae]MBR0677177.1 pimeloyl-CoA dehydrogenase small subunit [Neoroseomonas alkaliterrae]